ncbi:hypothetical protein Micbo1qcDRAFT_157077, partial [Microdochium bolleyi]
MEFRRGRRISLFLYLGEGMAGLFLELSRLSMAPSSHDVLPTNSRRLLECRCKVPSARRREAAACFGTSAMTDESE